MGYFKRLDSVMYQWKKWYIWDSKNTVKYNGEDCFIRVFESSDENDFILTLNNGEFLGHKRETTTTIQKWQGKWNGKGRFPAFIKDNLINIICGGWAFDHNFKIGRALKKELRDELTKKQKEYYLEMLEMVNGGAIK